MGGLDPVSYETSTGKEILEAFENNTLAPCAMLIMGLIYLSGGLR